MWFQVAIYTLIHTIPPTLKNTPLWIIRKPHKHLPSSHRTFFLTRMNNFCEWRLSNNMKRPLMNNLVKKNSLSWNAHLWMITEMAPLVINLLVLEVNNYIMLLWGGLVECLRNQSIKLVNKSFFYISVMTSWTTKLNMGGEYRICVDINIMLVSLATLHLMCVNVRS